MYGDNAVRGDLPVLIHNRYFRGNVKKSVILIPAGKLADILSVQGNPDIGVRVIKDKRISLSMKALILCAFRRKHRDAGIAANLITSDRIKNAFDQKV